jgi:hypothetical protein
MVTTLLQVYFNVGGGLQIWTAKWDQTQLSLQNEAIFREDYSPELVGLKDVLLALLQPIRQ